jgi:hypothetical protein
MDCLVRCCVATALAGCGIVGKDCSLGLGGAFAFSASYFFCLPKAQTILWSIYFASRRPFFLMLAYKKEGKEQDTPASAFILCYSAWRASIEIGYGHYV